MAPQNITIALADDNDAASFASIMTASFAVKDAAWALIWGQQFELHDKISVIGLFSPIVKPFSVAYKAIDSTNGKTVGFAVWTLPNQEPKKGGAMPDLPGVNMELFNAKHSRSNSVKERDYDQTKDMYLSFCFVHPDYQRQGIATALLEPGKLQADELGTKWWCLSTPDAMAAYQKNGWSVVERLNTDLSIFGGVGIYSQAWMMREHS